RLDALGQPSSPGPCGGSGNLIGSRFDVRRRGVGRPALTDLGGIDRPPETSGSIVKSTFSDFSGRFRGRFFGVCASVLGMTTSVCRESTNSDGGVELHKR